MWKTMKPLRMLLAGVLCVTLMLFPVPKASADLIEYALIVQLIALAASLVHDADVPPASPMLVNHLATAVEGARAASMVGNQVAEHSRLSKAIGAAEALIGVTSSCDQCGDLKGVLQQIIGQAALLKTKAVGASGTCQPNGIVGPNEQCDPLAIVSGCPVDTRVPMYCSDRCEVAPTP